MPCIEVPDTDQNSLPGWKYWLGYPWLDEPGNEASWSWAQFQKGQPTSCKTRDAFSCSPL